MDSFAKYNKRRRIKLPSALMAHSCTAWVLHWLSSSNPSIPLVKAKMFGKQKQM